MGKMVQLFQYIESKNKPGEFVDVSYFLLELGYTTHESKRDFIDELVADGYLKMRNNPLNIYSTTKAIGYPTDDIDENIAVQLKGKGRQYLIDNQRSETNVISNQRISLGTIGGMIVGIIGLLFGLYQYYNNVEKDIEIKRQGVTITKMQTTIDSLRSQSQLLQQIQRTKQLPHESQTKPKPDKK